MSVGSEVLPDSPQKSPLRSPEVVAPPLAQGVVGMPRCNVNLVKLGEPRSHIKLLDSIPSIPITVAPVASPITVLPTNGILQEDEDKGGVPRVRWIIQYFLDRYTKKKQFPFLFS